MQAIAILPTRYGSQRFPGKPLAMILGKPMIQHTVLAAKRAKTINRVVVATDDERIAAAVTEIGGEVIMTSADCPNGTARVLEAFLKLSDEEQKQYDLIVNVQGDEPGLNAEHIDDIVTMMRANSGDAAAAVVGTAASPILNEQEARDYNVVKTVLDHDSNALYFSRAMIPSNKTGSFDPQVPYLRHIGIYAFRQSFLPKYPLLPSSLLQNFEDLEQLRILQAGYKIQVAIVSKALPGVDVPNDIQKIESIFLGEEAPII